MLYFYSLEWKYNNKIDRSFINFVIFTLQPDIHISNALRLQLFIFYFRTFFNLNIFANLIGFFIFQKMSLPSIIKKTKDRFIPFSRVLRIEFVLSDREYKKTLDCSDTK